MEEDFYIEPEYIEDEMDEDVDERGLTVAVFLVSCILGLLIWMRFENINFDQFEL